MKGILLLDKSFLIRRSKPKAGSTFSARDRFATLKGSVFTRYRSPYSGKTRRPQRGRKRGFGIQMDSSSIPVTPQKFLPLRPLFGSGQDADSWN